MEVFWNPLEKAETFCFKNPLCNYIYGSLRSLYPHHQRGFSSYNRGEVGWKKSVEMVFMGRLTRSYQPTDSQNTSALNRNRWVAIRCLPSPVVLRSIYICVISVTTPPHLPAENCREWAIAIARNGGFSTLVICTYCLLKIVFVSASSSNFRALEVRELAL